MDKIFIIFLTLAVLTIVVLAGFMLQMSDNSNEYKFYDTVKYKCISTSSDQTEYTFHKKVEPTNRQKNVPVIALPDELRTLIKSAQPGEVEQNPWVWTPNLKDIFENWNVYEFEELTDGWLVSYNRGEWGGTLVWFSNNGTHQQLGELFLNVNDFEVEDDRVYSAQGWDISQAEGYLDIYIRRQDKWVHEKTILAPASIHEVSVNQRALMIGSKKGTLFFDSQWQESNCKKNA